MSTTEQITKLCKDNDLPVTIGLVVASRYFAHRYDTLYKFVTSYRDVTTMDPIIDDIIVRMFILDQLHMGRGIFLKKLVARGFTHTGSADLITDDEVEKKRITTTLCNNGDVLILGAIEAMELAFKSARSSELEDEFGSEFRATEDDGESIPEQAVERLTEADEDRGDENGDTEADEDSGDGNGDTEADDEDARADVLLQTANSDPAPDRGEDGADENDGTEDSADEKNDSEDGPEELTPSTPPAKVAGSGHQPTGHGTSAVSASLSISTRRGSRGRART